MKRKILAILLVLVFGVVALASCDLIPMGPEDPVDECEHTYSDKWSTSAEQHWRAATCEHGENKADLGNHTDADEDGFCDVCAYEVGHEHLFALDWSSDDSKHWKAALCTHTDVRGEEDLHKDEDTDGVCDVCEGHVHILDVSGYCTGCGEEVEPIDETDIAAVITAATVKAGKINGGSISYRFDGKSLHENSVQAMSYDHIFVIGTNGTYNKRTVAGVAAGVLTGQTAEIIEHWIPYGTDENIMGIELVTLPDGTIFKAQQSSFGSDELSGYYYALSTFLDAYTADEMLYKLYEAATGENSADLEVEHDAENNKYVFSFNVFVVQAATVNGGEETYYTANYYDLSVEFTYSDDYAILSLDIVCDCYTSDPGGDFGGTWEEDIDLDYDPVTNTITFRENIAKDTYRISVTQTVGEREEIVLNDGSQYIPDDFGVYSNPACSTTATELELLVGDNNKVLYVGTPVGTFISFVKDDLELTVTTKGGAATTGLQVTLVGEEIQIFPYAAGEYVITAEAVGVTKTVSVEVKARPVQGTPIEVEVTSAHEWVDKFTFTAEVSGYYTFYIPVNLGIWRGDASDPTNIYTGPMIDSLDYHYDPDAPHVIERMLIRTGQSVTFTIAAPSVGTYVIGYEYSVS